MGFFRRKKNLPVPVVESSLSVTAETAEILPQEGEPSDAQAELLLKEAIFRQLALAMKIGDVGGYEAQTLVLLHRKWLCLFWREGMYSKDSHLMMGNIYTADRRFGDFYDKRVGRGGAQFLRDAIEIYVIRGGMLLEKPEEGKKISSGAKGLTEASRKTGGNALEE